MSNPDDLTDNPLADGKPHADPAAGRIAATRKRPLHGVLVSPSHPTIVILTVCTRKRERWLATPEVQDLLEDIWSEALAWLTGKYVLMPDHIHLLAGLADPDVTLERWVRYWKSMFTKRHRMTVHRWQPDHWDVRLRSADNYEKTWEYVRQNPVRQGLVVQAEAWPFQGQIHRLPWDEGL